MNNTDYTDFTAEFTGAYGLSRRQLRVIREIRVKSSRVSSE